MSFVLDVATLSLPELRWAFDRGIIGAGSVVEAALAIVGAGSEDPVATQLAMLGREELPSVSEILPSNASTEGSDEQEHSRQKWIWIILSWVYERGHSRADVFNELESLYADLGYPEEMVPFGPYAPAYEGTRDPVEVREQILREWRRYLASGKSMFGREK